MALEETLRRGTSIDPLLFSLSYFSTMEDLEDSTSFSRSHTALTF
jgi:hypothetical protein